MIPVDLKRPVVVLGFGRSGTTWISDIISKITGYIILFEPFHPAVFKESQEFLYRRLSQVNHQPVLSQIQSCHRKEIRNRWLLRNHLNSPLEQISDRFIDLVWQESKILGFKSIRQNQSIPWFKEVLDASVVYIMRHPLSVIASIKKRPNFWKEFNLQTHLDKFKAEYPLHPSISHYQWTEIEHIWDRAGTPDEKMGCMWSLTQWVAVHDLQKSGLPYFTYEHFYMKPYEETRDLLDYLGYTSIDIHPSHLFTPSMVSLKTVHEISDTPLKHAGFSDFFWKDTLDDRSREKILSVVNQIASLDDLLYQNLSQCDYLTD